MAGISTAEEVLAACRTVLRSTPADLLHDLPISRLSGQPDWYPFEHTTWSVGEQIRQAFVRIPKLRKRADILEAVVGCAVSKNLRRGRQSFVMLLGHLAAQPFAGPIAELCADPDVSGHAVDTLIKMRAPGYAAQVRPLLSAQHAWIRRKAKTYLARYGA